MPPCCLSFTTLKQELSVTDERWSSTASRTEWVTLLNSTETHTHTHKNAMQGHLHTHILTWTRTRILRLFRVTTKWRATAWLILHTCMCLCVRVRCSVAHNPFMLIYPILTITKRVVYYKLDIILCSCVASCTGKHNSAHHSLIVENICGNQQLLNALGKQTTRNLQWNSWTTWHRAKFGRGCAHNS